MYKYEYYWIAKLQWMKQQKNQCDTQPSFLFHWGGDIKSIGSWVPSFYWIIFLINTSFSFVCFFLCLSLSHTHTYIHNLLKCIIVCTTDWMANISFQQTAVQQHLSPSYTFNLFSLLPLFVSLSEHNWAVLESKRKSIEFCVDLYYLCEYCKTAKRQLVRSMGIWKIESELQIPILLPQAK